MTNGSLEGRSTLRRLELSCVRVGVEKWSSFVYYLHVNGYVCRVGPVSNRETRGRDERKYKSTTLFWKEDRNEREKDYSTSVAFTVRQWNVLCNRCTVTEWFCPSFRFVFTVG